MARVVIYRTQRGSRIRRIFSPSASCLSAMCIEYHPHPSKQLVLHPSWYNCHGLNLSCELSMDWAMKAPTPPRLSVWLSVCLSLSLPLPPPSLSPPPPPPPNSNDLTTILATLLINIQLWRIRIEVNVHSHVEAGWNFQGWTVKLTDKLTMTMVTTDWSVVMSVVTEGFVGMTEAIHDHRLICDDVGTVTEG